MKITQLKIDDLVEVGGRLYKVHASKWANQSDFTMGKNKNGNYQGMKITLKVLREKELNELILKEKENGKIQ